MLSRWDHYLKYGKLPTKRSNQTKEPLRIGAVKQFFYEPHFFYLHALLVCNIKITFSTYPCLSSWTKQTISIYKHKHK